ncbi:UspA domain-containing protein [Halogeometricum pallidum JCM 14848]|uniref:UspA domain-containing protein n=1 Tax=Halogeometricum pallidum JCM 14848 TaxID=1227487 RepID=M0CZT4_HALPD|nr:universal stress protein [Halogeometricum pallidum]ELZ28725.1 UspA domain-containing protein [Halogeometricum pallidum JCM 14848]
MYQQILIPTDGSAGATKAIHEGVRLADLTGATVHGLYVVDTRDYNTLPESKWLTLADELEAAGETALEAIQAEAEAVGVPSETAIRKGIPHEEILRYVGDHDIDLIVMGTHGRTGFNRFLIGSVTEKIIRQTPIPVHIVRINEDD